MHAQSDSKTLDRFKLLILLALISLAIVLWVLLPLGAPSDETAQQLAGSQTATLTSSPTQPPASATPLPAATATLQPTPELPATPAVTPGETLTVDAAPAETEPASPAETLQPPDPESCPLAAPSQLSVGLTAQVITLLNVRSEPMIGENLLFVVLDNTLVEIIGGPVCQPHLDGAHWWWQIRLPEGETGWAVEAAYDGSLYYLEPAP
ncbi:MAG: hypothetical protein JW862_18105 [Anaerolineales bacterium]|nr:hypothetical protein [Anaerolineales bacterium]